MIIDEKCMQPPPPPYVSSAGPPPFPGSRRRGAPLSLASLPSHILLQIVYLTFPQRPGIDQGRIERQRKTLYWLATSFRLVNRALYVASMHILRSTYLPSYDSLIRPPYTSDPFPLLSNNSTAPDPCLNLSPLQTIQRETAVLDLFIALKVREDVWMDDSELHLEREESFKDLFDLNQPRSRLEDLVRVYGIREAVVSVSPPSTTTSSTHPSPRSSTSNLAPGFRNSAANPASQAPMRTNPGSHAPPPSSRTRVKPIPFASLSISFSSRKVGLVMMTPGAARKRTIVEVARTRDERLEVAAKKLVKELRVWLVHS